MAVVQWTQQQVLNQLDSGQRWSGPGISFAFPAAPPALHSQGEAQGFRAANGAQQTAMRLAMQTWDDLVPQTLLAGRAGSSDLEFAFTTTGIGFARAYAPPLGSIWFNASYGDLASTSVGAYGFVRYVQEIGHALGLDPMGGRDNPWAPSAFQDSQVLSVMSHFGPRNSAPLYSPEVRQADWTDMSGRAWSPQTPMPNDVMAIQSVYGVSTTTRSEDTVYGFNSTVTGAIGAIHDFSRNPHPVLTIFDSGGTDTLDLSGWSSPSRIDLRAGAFSSANQMTSNIAIAQGTVIENAVGGSADDVLIGNDADNRLEGGTGNDVLIGGAGNDQLSPGGGDDLLEGGPGDDSALMSLRLADYVVTLDAAGVTLASSEGTVRAVSVERFVFADLARSLAELGQGDRTAPRLLSLSPADDAATVPADAPLVLRFDEPVKAGNGTLSLLDASGATLRSVPAGDVQVQFEGDTVRWVGGAALPVGDYSARVSPGALVDLAGNAFAGIAGSTAWNFRVAAPDSAAPQLLRLSPGDEDSGVAPGALLVLQFNEPVQRGSGDIVIRDGDGAVLRRIAIADASQVSLDGTRITVDPATDLPRAGSFSVTVDTGALRDAAGNVFSGLASASAWNFRTASAELVDDYPFATSTPGVLVPGAGAVSGSIETPDDADLFRIELVAGRSYVFTLQRTPDGLADPQLGLYGPGLGLVASDDDSAGGGNSRLSFTAPTSGSYYVAAADYGLGTGAYTLRAALQDTAPPLLQSLSPADDATAVAVGANLVLGFSEAVRAGAGSLRLFDAGGALLREIAARDAGQVGIAGAVVTVNPAFDLWPGTAYSVQVDADAFRDLAGLPFAGIAGSTVWNFGTAVAAGGDDFPLSAATTGVVVPGGLAVNGRIDFVDDGDLFRTELRAGVTYRIEMVGAPDSPVDPYLVLYGRVPGTELINFDDDSGALPQDALLHYTPGNGGTYHLAAFDDSQALGAYRVQISVPADDQLGSVATTGRLTVGGVVAGDIGVPTDADWFAVSLVGGQAYAFDLARSAGGLEDPYLVLYGSDGLARAWDDDNGGEFNARVNFTAPVSGTYYAGASDFGDGVGGYTLTAVQQNQVAGTAGADLLRGTTGADALSGRGGADELIGGAGNDLLDGGAGIDTAVYAGESARFDLLALGEGWIVRDVVGSEGIDNLLGIERLHFADRRLALDLDGHAGTTVKILGAVFGAAYLSEAGYVGIGLHLLDGGMDTPTLMRLALDARLGASPSDTAVVELLWSNLMGESPSPANRELYVGALRDGSFTQVGLATLAGDTTFNLVNIGFDELQLVGVPYTPPAA